MTVSESNTSAAQPIAPSPSSDDAASAAELPSAGELPSAQQLRGIAKEAAWAVGPVLRLAFRAQMDIDIKTSAHDLVTIYDKQTEQQLVQLLSQAIPDSRFTGEEGGAQGSGRVEWIIDPIDGTSNFAHGFAMFSVSIAAAVDDQVIAGVVYDPVNELTFSADDDAAYLQTREQPEQALKPTPKLAADGDPRRENQLNLVTSFPGAEMLARRGTEALEGFAELVTTYSSVRRVISGALELCHAAAGWADVAAGGKTNPWDVAAGQLVLRRAGGRYLPFGAREGRSWEGAESLDAHLAPGYVGLAPGVEAPTAARVFADFAYRG